ncbi:MAG: hypothetical protein HOM11_09560 [Methylococcales bacterium]|jgi:hypothetical protein|nr:hypothetical protein [Methylococcales bacterium]MBT7444253.1 hypothetical protein [Methylococcales bacterium]
MTFKLASLLLVILFNPLSTTWASNIQPISIKTYQSQLGLTTVAITLPVKPFISDRNSLIYQWKIESLNKGLRALYLNPTPYLNHLRDKNKDKTAITEITLYGLIDQGGSDTLYFHAPGVLNVKSSEDFQLQVDLSKAKPGTKEIQDEWVKARGLQWFLHTGRNRGNIFSHLIELIKPVYGIQPSKKPRGNRNNAGFVSALSLFSGETAIRESLYEQTLLGHKSTTGKPVSISLLTPPKIQSHPYESILKQAKTLPDFNSTVPTITQLVASDHFMLMINDAKKALPWLENAADTGFNFASLISGGHLERGLVNRYLNKLNITRPLAEQVLDKASITQMAITSPDLYFTEGTDVTVILESQSNALIQEAIKLVLGVTAETESSGIFYYTGSNSNQNPAYIAFHEQWLILSSSKKAVLTALNLAKNNGQGSLGASAEFQYMNHVLPTQQDTSGFYAYLSDPFIRKMISPTTKILQLRRSLARSKLEKIIAAKLLYKMDHQQEADQATLIKQGYLTTAHFNDGDISLHQDGTVSSKKYGRLKEMTPIENFAIDEVEAWEAKAYKTYSTDYSDQWSQFFDPIGIRFTAGSPWEIQTVILPLVENTLYNTVRQTLGSNPKPMPLPQVTPTPISQLSFQLNDTSRNTIANSYLLDEIFGHRAEDTAPWLEWLGHNIHFALYDNDPVIAFGSGEAISMLTLPTSTGRGRQQMSAQNIAFGIAAAMLTQPFAIFIEVNDEAAFKSAFNKIIYGARRNFPSNELKILHHLLGDNGDRGWVITFDVLQMLNFQLYTQVIDGYLVISNREFDYQIDAATTPNMQPSNAGIHFDFEQINLMAPRLFTGIARTQQKAVKQNIRRLLPFMLAGAASIDAAIAEYQKQFGISLSHPEGGHWQWNAHTQTLSSNQYGATIGRQLPSYFDLDQSDKDYGLFKGLSQFDLRFSFYDDGAHITLKGKDNSKQ